MLSFFRINASYNIFFLLLLLVAIRIPMFMFGTPPLIPEMQWTLVGEQMNKGFMLYSDIWDNTAPLSALMYSLIYSIFGRSQVAFQVAALIFAAIQVVYFNVMVNSRDVFPKRNYIPGLFFVLFLNISFDCCTLSPVLMSTTFLLLALGTLLKQMGRNGATDEVFEIGFYIAIAMLFYPPTSVFILWAFLSLTFYSSATLRQHSLLFFGWFFPLGLTSLFFYLFDSFDPFWRNFISSVFQIRQYNLNEFQTLLVTIFIPVMLSVMGFLRLLGAGSFVNFQTRTQQIMVIWALVVLLAIGLMPFLAPMQFLLLVPVFSFFTVHYFNSIRKTFLAELIFLVVLGTVLFIHYQAVYLSNSDDNFGQLTNLRLEQKTSSVNIQNKRILVLGEGLGEYAQNLAATPYLNWQLARYELENIDNYQHVINILRNFEKDAPDYIIDKINLAPQLFARIPLLARRYKKVSSGIYQKV
jgi:hypothetical protein